jgi:hypothetical protein
MIVNYYKKVCCISYSCLSSKGQGLKLFMGPLYCELQKIVSAPIIVEGRYFAWLLTTARRSYLIHFCPSKVKVSNLGFFMGRWFWYPNRFFKYWLYFATAGSVEIVSISMSSSYYYYYYYYYLILGVVLVEAWHSM